MERPDCGTWLRAIYPPSSSAAAPMTDGRCGCPGNEAPTERPVELHFSPVVPASRSNFGTQPAGRASGASPTSRQVPLALQWIRAVDGWPRFTVYPRYGCGTFMVARSYGRSGSPSSGSGSRTRHRERGRATLVWSRSTAGGFIACWNAVSGLLEAEVDSGLTGEIGVESSEDRSLLVLYERSSANVELWDLADPVRLARLDRPETAVRLIAPDPRGRYVLTVSDTSSAQLWNARSGSLLHRLEHTGDITTARFTSNGNAILIGTSDGAMTVWQSTTGEISRQLSSSEGFISCLDTAYGGAVLLAVSGGIAPQMWDVHGAHVLGRLSGKLADITHCDFDSYSEFALLSSRDETFVWSVSLHGDRRY